MNARDEETKIEKTGLAGLLTVNEVAELLAVSPRTVYRLTDSGRMPAPVRLNALIRWRETDLHSWITEGCPAIRKPNSSTRGGR